MELCLVQAKEKREDDPTVVKQIIYLKVNESMIQRKEFEEIERTKENRLRPSIEDPPILKLNKLPNHLEYALLWKDLKLPIIVASNLKASQIEKLLKDLVNIKGP